MRHQLIYVEMTLEIDISAFGHKESFQKNNKPQGFNLEAPEKWVVWDSNPELIS
jgi:hypothetical protein